MNPARPSGARASVQLGRQGRAQIQTPALHAERHTCPCRAGPACLAVNGLQALQPAYAQLKPIVGLALIVTQRARHKSSPV
jgi:hypothetical protein